MKKKMYIIPSIEETTLVTSSLMQAASPGPNYSPAEGTESDPIEGD